MLYEPGLGTLPFERDRLASDEPNVWLPLPPEPRFRMTASGLCRHLIPTRRTSQVRRVFCCSPSTRAFCDMPDLLFLELALLGLCSGFLAGLLGVGGGMVLVPFLTYFLDKRGIGPDLAVKMAIATAMATIVFTSISSLRAHHGRGAVRWDIVRSLAPGIVTGGLLASLGVFALLRGKYLALFFGVFIGFMALRMLRSSNQPTATRTLPGPMGLYGAGTGWASSPAWSARAAPSSASPS